MIIIYYLCINMNSLCIEKNKWFEFLGVMFDDYELYYGFIRFVIELNELNKDEVKFLFIIDIRFRLD